MADPWHNWMFNMILKLLPVYEYSCAESISKPVTIDVVSMKSFKQLWLVKNRKEIDLFESIFKPVTIHVVSLKSFKQLWLVKNRKEIDLFESIFKPVTIHVVAMKSSKQLWLVKSRKEIDLSLTWRNYFFNRFLTHILTLDTLLSYTDS